MKTIYWVSIAHILIIAASNYLVKIPFEILGYHSTLGTFVFPLIYLTTDLTVRLYGADEARKVIFRVMLPALFISYFVSAGMELDGFVARVAFASFAAYVLGQLIDVKVFAGMRHNKSWWAAPAVSSTAGNLVDTFIFFSIAFYASSNSFMADNWVEIAWVDVVIKIAISGVVLIPAYGILIKCLGSRIISNRS